MEHSVRRLVLFLVCAPVAFFMGALLVTALSGGHKLAWIAGGLLAVLVLLLIVVTHDDLSTDV